MSFDSRVNYHPPKHSEVCFGVKHSVVCLGVKFSLVCYALPQSVLCYVLPQSIVCYVMCLPTMPLTLDVTISAFLTMLCFTGGGGLKNSSLNVLLLYI